jgi:hypothetical protein
MPTQLAASTLHKTFGLRKPAFKNVDKPVKRDIPPLPQDTIKFNELIGLPLHSATLTPSPLLDYQLAYINLIHTHHRLIFNKSRKIGATETALRAICQQCYGDYIGHNVIIVAGNRQDEANIFLERFEDLFIKGWKIGPNKTLKERDLIMNISSDRIDLYSGVTIRTIPANPRALRAQANVKCVFFSEAAHINSLNDEKIWGAVKPIIANDDSADIIVESTPNGIRNFFYDEFHNMENGYFKLQYDYTWALGKLISQEFIDREKRDPRPWYFAQEYQCKFLTGGKSAITIPDQAISSDTLIDLDEL